MGSVLSIVIVNYKTPELLCNCLNTVFNQVGNLLFEVIVVDNHSEDNSREHVLTRFPEVRWIQMSYNAGFARANNEGIRQSKGEVVLLLNSDTLNQDNAIAGCFQAFIRSDYVACGVQLLNADLSPQISGNYFMRGGLNNLLPLPYIGNFIKWLGNLVNVKKPHVPDASAETVVDWINGAFLMVKKEVTHEAGLMDEDFFLYAEEAEWCARLGKFGRLAIFGQFRVIHLQGETSNATFRSSGKGYYNLYDRKGLQIMLSNFVRIRKQFGTGWLLLHLFVYTATVPVFMMGRLLSAIAGQRRYGSVQGFAANVLRLWRYAPRIIRNRPYFYKVL